MKSIFINLVTVFCFTVIIFCHGSFGLTCFDCIEGSTCDEDDPPMCGGLYCARLKVLNVTLQYMTLHTCLNSVHLIDNVTLQVNSCAPLDDLDPLWPDTLAINTKTGINLTDFTHAALIFCDESDTLCNDTKCDFDIYDNKNQNLAGYNYISFFVIFVCFLFFVTTTQ